ncbi:BnaC09g31430D [Brassica napus]|uniref:(rape) hypothetical protein n=1 Tax=Brassica napus TaxID=3708 RepID=A0A078G4H5_BRANA|nr:unnamed protein product [Brassica napus]CDY19877.1 BnaC09g31430D [Brassica napus]
MVELDIQVPLAYDPFAEAQDTDAPGTKEYIHVRIQQRNGKKSLTTVQVSHFLVQTGIAKKDQIKIHGF